MSASKLRLYLLKVLKKRDRWAERALLIYFLDAWDRDIEPDQYALRAYCELLFNDALKTRRSLWKPAGRPISLLAERDLTVAALFWFLRRGGVGYMEALDRVHAAFNISTKLVEKIVLAEGSMKALPALLDDNDRAALARMLDALRKPPPLK